MNNEKKIIIIATGGTGGHIMPAISLYSNLKKNNFEPILTTDFRGFNFMKDSKEFKIKIINALSFKNNNKIVFFFSSIWSLLTSIIFLIKKKPNLTIGMGGYSSFPTCLASVILRVPLIIYENNLHLGKANRVLSFFAKKIFLAHPEIDGLKSKFRDKSIRVGNIIRQEIFSSNLKDKENNFTSLKILILGGSQAAKVFADKLPNIFIKCKKNGIRFKIFQQCIANQNEALRKIYKENNIDHEIFNFTNNIIDYYDKTNFVISRAGSSSIAELLNCNKPMISIPLPTSADNHQYKNAEYYEKKGFCVLMKEEEISEKLYELIESIHKDKSILEQIEKKQREYTDKDTYNIVNLEIKKII